MRLLVTFLTVFTSLGVCDDLFHDRGNAPDKPQHYSTLITDFADESSFAADFECQFQCKGGEKVFQKRYVKNFSPRALKLEPGNGNFYTGLSQTLWPWARGWCIEGAVKTCDPKGKNLGAIKNVKILKLGSGTWKLHEQPDCRPRTTYLLSPYSKSVAKNPPIQTSTAESSHKTELRDSKEISSCKKPLKANMCYGDCTIEVKSKTDPTKEVWEQTLASADSFATRKATVCADDFLAEYKGKNLSPDILVHLCENYFWNSIHNPKDMIFKCAALRASVPCAELVRGM